MPSRKADKRRRWIERYCDRDIPTRFLTAEQMERFTW
jgi:hypothetical protein